MKQYVCEKCRKSVALSDKFCGHCGAQFLSDEVDANSVWDGKNSIDRAKL